MWDAIGSPGWKTEKWIFTFRLSFSAKSVYLVHHLIEDPNRW
jgi:hypothetical protein